MDLLRAFTSMIPLLINASLFVEIRKENSNQRLPQSERLSLSNFKT